MMSSIPDPLDSCLIRDRQRMRQWQRALGRMTPDSPEYLAQQRRLSELHERSAGIAALRRRNTPTPDFDKPLPVVEHLEIIREALDSHQVIVLCGETGSGKSTQLPQICLDRGRGVFGRIAHTQPRRIAARSLAARISDELGVETGTAVGYKVRFSDRVSDQTQIKLLTDGMLLAEIQSDRWLNEYDTIIIDEAHERTLNIDFLLGYLKQLLPKRPELKLIITSATIDPQRFAKHFGAAPVIEVSGRSYPVEIRYQPPDEDSDAADPMLRGMLDAVDEVSRLDRGDILIFFSGEREIREAAEALHKHKLELTDILPLYARLGAAEQQRVFKSSGKRKIVLATNVAETSLTVPGIRYVIDTGLARISRYSPRSKIQRLPVEPISQASANQRAGRCGRVAAGVCIRLYSEEHFLSRREFVEPEIQRTNLASVILQMRLLGFGEIEDFPFLDPPDSRLIRDGYRVLEEVGAVTRDRHVTRVGKQLARLPVDPRIGRMLLESAHHGCLREVLVIAAMLSVQDPRDRPADKRQQADEAHALYRDEESDFMTYLALWREIGKQRRELSHAKFRKWCRRGFLSWNRVREWQDIHRQLRAQMHEMGYKDNNSDSRYEEIHRSILSGLLSHIGLKSKDRDYLGARNSRFHIFPGSGVFKKQPKWVMAAEIVETTKPWARGVARIQPEWIEQAAGHLLTRNYSEPHWQARRGQVGGYEKVSLFGLTLVARRRINFGPIDPALAREIFIRFALVEGDFKTRAPFFRHNQELIEDIRAMEAKARRHDLLVDEEVIYQWYAQRIPEGIHTSAGFEKWLKQASREQPKLLHMRSEDLLQQDPARREAEMPDALTINNTPLPLKYHFSPGSESDGVTLVVPLTLINQVPDARGDWLVPGLLAERIEAMLRGLPKSLRKRLVPVPDTARQCAAALSPSEQPLHQAVAAWLKQRLGVHIPEDAWRSEDIPAHLRMRFQLVDEQGKALAESRDLGKLKGEWAERASSEFGGKPKAQVETHARWDFGALPETQMMRQAGIEVRGYPALIDQGDGVSLGVLDSAANAEAAMRRGLRRLFMLGLGRDMRYLRKNLTGLRQMRLWYAKAPGGNASSPVDLQEELLTLIVDRAFIDDNPPIRDAESFERAMRDGKPRLMGIANESAERIGDILEQAHRIRRSLTGKTQLNWLDSVKDMRAQLDGLVYHGFIEETPWERLEELPRYLKALAIRLDKLGHAAARDQQRLRELTPFQQRWSERYQRMLKSGQHDPRLEEIRWLIEELRISLFAQEVKTRVPVSLKRLEKRWESLGL